MTNPTNKEELVARLEAAEAGSRELDASVWKTLTGESAAYPFDDEPHVQYGDSIMWVELPRYTTSLDAALALAERVLPGWIVSLDGLEKGCWYGAVSIPNRSSHTPGGYFYARSPTPALALCIAILRTTPESPHNPGQGDGG